MRFAGRGNGTSEISRRCLAGMADALCQGTSPLAANFYKTRISGNLIERGESALRFRQQLVVEVRFELQKRVVDSEAVVLHAPFEQADEFLLAGESFENLH